MRLIDADKFAIEEPKLWDWSSVDGISSTSVLKQCIWDVQCAPVVEAIPVEWIEKYIENQYKEGHHYSKFIIEELAGYGNNFYYDKARHIKEMLTEWGKVEEAEDE